MSSIDGGQLILWTTYSSVNHFPLEGIRQQFLIFLRMKTNFKDRVNE